MSKPVKRSRRSANPERGEAELVLEGQSYVLRPSYAAQVAIETKSGLSYTDLVRAGHSGSLRIEHAAIIAAEMINAGAGDDPSERVSADRVGEMIFESGFPHVAAVLTLVMIESLQGGRTKEGNVKAVVA